VTELLQAVPGSLASRTERLSANDNQPPSGALVEAAVPRTVLICHADDMLNREGLARWLAHGTTLAAVIVLEEPRQRIKRRIRREIKRVGWLRFLDVLAFRLHYRLFQARRDHEWEDRTRMQICARYPAIGGSTKFLHATSPNAPEVESLLRESDPDIVIARCKSLLKESIFSIARCGTFVMHPGICPQYRNAHGCFWALAQQDRQNVGMTLLKIDRGVDTGPSSRVLPLPVQRARRVAPCDPAQSGLRQSR